MKKLILLTLLTTLLTGCAASQTEVLSPETMENTSEEVSNEVSEQTQENTEGNQEVSLASSYADFSQDQYNQLKGTEPFALFFHAEWCPKCQKLDSEITENQSELSGKILKTNFDQETDLKKEYGVNMQTTFVIFDASGEVSTKLTNPSLQELNTALAQA